MAASTINDVVIYQDEMYSGVIEIIEQNADFVSETTQGAIQYITNSLKGEFKDRSFWELGEDMIFDRDPTDIDDVNVEGLSQSNLISPKMDLRIGPIQATEDQFRKLQEQPEQMSFIVGTQVGKNLAVQWLNRALTGGVAALTKSTDTHFDATTATDPEDRLISTRVLNKALGGIMGDGRERVRALVMHSGAFTALTDGQIVDKLTGVTDRIVYGGTTATLGLPVLVTDSPALIDADPAGDGSDPAQYKILALTENALLMEESEGGVVMGTDRIFGKGNLMRIMQGETSVNISIKGWSFTGGASPAVADIGTSANWDYLYTDVKSGAGLAITVNQDV